MCLGCNAFCCRLRVDLTLFDIARIFHMEGRPMEEFTTVAYAAGDDRFAIRLKGGLFKLVLMNDNGRCHFAKSGDLRCAIEKAKPAICISYPFSIRDGVPYLRNNVACPFDNLLIADRTKMSKEVLDAMVYEADRYGETVSVWNSCAKGDEELSSFLKFAANDIESDRSRAGVLKKSLGRIMLRMGLR